MFHFCLQFFIKYFSWLLIWAFSCYQNKLLMLIYKCYTNILTSLQLLLATLALNQDFFIFKKSVNLVIIKTLKCYSSSISLCRKLDFSTLYFFLFTNYCCNFTFYSVYLSTKTVNCFLISSVYCKIYFWKLSFIC